MVFLMRYIAAGALLLAIAAGAWGWRQDQRADRLEAELAAANTHIARLKAEAEAKGLIEHAVDQVQRLDGGAIADWLRNRAGRNEPALLPNPTVDADRPRRGPGG